MNKEKFSIIMMLVVVTALTGCGSVGTQYVAEAMDRPIMSADEAQSMVQITVTQLGPEEDQEIIVAANEL
jgi:predicted small lipoprotein YifL